MLVSCGTHLTPTVFYLHLCPSCLQGHRRLPPFGREDAFLSASTNSTVVRREIFLAPRIAGQQLSCCAVIPGALATRTAQGRSNDSEAKDSPPHIPQGFVLAISEVRVSAFHMFHFPLPLWPLATVPHRPTRESECVANLLPIVLRR